MMSCALQVNENTELLMQFRDNILSILNHMNTMGGVMVRFVLSFQIIAFCLNSPEWNRTSFMSAAPELTIGERFCGHKANSIVH